MGIEDNLADMIESGLWLRRISSSQLAREILALIKGEIFEALADWGGPQHKYFNDAVNVLQKHFDGKDRGEG